MYRNLPAWCFETRRCEGHSDYYCTTVQYKVNFHHLDGKALCSRCLAVETAEQGTKVHKQTESLIQKDK